MKLVRFDDGNGTRCGVLQGGEVRDLGAAFVPAASGDMAALLALPPGEIEAATRGAPLIGEGLFTLKAPIANPPKIICAWVNYPNPSVAKPPELPIFFSKYASAITDPGAPIRLPRIASDIVAEPELTAVIGRSGKHIAEADALAHVAGYTIVNDVTAFSHRLQVVLGSTGPYMMAKTFDTFAPCGPVIVTADEVADPHALRVHHWQNGELMTEASTNQAVFHLPRLIAYLSGFFSLQPGDLILTGSPFPLHGKPQFLAAGDVVRIKIEGIGTLENPVLAEE